MTKNDQKWPKMALKWPQMTKYDKNTVQKGQNGLETKIFLGHFWHILTTLNQL